MGEAAEPPQGAASARRHLGGGGVDHHRAVPAAARWKWLAGAVFGRGRQDCRNSVRRSQMDDASDDDQPSTSRR
ncbi:MAG: hypothetical protein M0Z42_10265 [Actinomycetota bacterium]|nr:hypothetical protein [Actinomycetota bacterium]